MRFTSKTAVSSHIQELERSRFELIETIADLNRRLLKSRVALAEIEMRLAILRRRLLQLNKEETP